jgi:hypothetical protein
MRKASAVGVTHPTVPVRVEKVVAAASDLTTAGQRCEEAQPASVAIASSRRRTPR